MADLHTQVKAVSRSEARWVSGLTCLACVVRLAHLDEVAVSHFDEGVYVLWAWLGDYPAKEFYAPPLYPWLVGRIFQHLGPADLWALALSALVGTATVPLIWWLARRWYGPAAGVSSAAMAAFSGFHIAFSRMALTDAMFTFWFVLAMALISEAVCRFDGWRKAEDSERAPTNGPSPFWLWAIGAGLAASAAMYTKYNGLLVLVFTGIALVIAGLLRNGSLRSLWSRPLPAFLLIGAVATLLYVPWFWHVQTRYGYSVLLAHHRGYGTGLASWPDNLMTMLVSQWCLDRHTGFVGLTVGLFAAMACSDRTIRMRELLLVATVAAVGFVLGDAFGWLVAAGVVVFRARSSGSIGVLHATWLIGFLLLVPLYRPYARLMLPLIAAGWIAAGGLLSRVLDKLNESRGLGSAPGRWSVAWVACLIGAAITYFVHTRTEHSTRGDSDSTLASACNSLQRSLPSDQRVAGFVRPPVRFHLRGMALDQMDPASEAGLVEIVKSASGYRYVLIDRGLLRDNPGLREQLAHSTGQLSEIARVSYRPSMVVLLDDFGRGCLSRDLEQRVEETYELVLYRVAIEIR